jgi:shikimate dehydrogenase
MTTTVTETTRLGLIGDNIADSKTPRLHELAGGLLGRPTTYDRLVPKTLGLDFDAVFDKARDDGYRGLNITYPYKERVIARVTVDEPLVARLGACNTVVFDADGPRGYNTDWSGFKAAYRHGLSDTPTGAVCMIGAGGVGKAVAFGLIDLGMTDLRLVERDLPKAEALAEALRAAAPGLTVTVTGDGATGASGASGLVNCTPVGMVGYGGTPLPREHMAGAAWAFDAVYTPVDTQFLQDSAAEGLKILSGYELYFYQGLHAISIFHGVDMDEAVLRAALKE